MIMFTITAISTTVLLFTAAIFIQSSRYQFIPNPDPAFRTLHLGSHSLRVKRTHICGGSDQQNAIKLSKKYSGYVDNIKTGDHLFFTFFESRRTASGEEANPLVLWLNGGPGCSSLVSALTEIGPCIVSSHHDGVAANPFRWNDNANIVFLDQPANTGYSYGSYNVKNSKGAARDIFMFLQLFLEAFPHLATSQLHIAGESFAGHYIPAAAAEILTQNKACQFTHIKLQSLMIGNGWVDPRTQLNYYEPYGCANDSFYKPIFDDATCKKMRSSLPTCQKLMNSCYKYQNSITCVPAGFYCQKTQLGPYDNTDRNNFDIRIRCQRKSELCYNITDRVNLWANKDETRQELGVDPSKGIFTTCNDKVAYQFALSGDMTISYAPQVAEALENGVRVLVYAGDMDWTCNWYGSLAWTIALQWSGQHGYGEATDLNWYSSTTGKLAGQLRVYKNLMFLKVNNAGHWVPYDQPEHSMEFFNAWLDNRTLV